MRLAGRTGSDEDAATLGKYFLELYGDTSWIERRVETIHILDDHRVERRITLDLDIENLVARAQSCLKREDAPTTVLVPLTYLEKSLFLDFDLTGPDEAPLHLVTSEEDSRAAQCMMLAYLQRTSRAPISVKLRDKLFEIAAEFPGDRMTGSAEEFTVSQIRPKLQTGFTDSDRAQWSNWLDDQEFMALLSMFSVQYMPIAELPVVAGQRKAMVKIRLVDPWDEPVDNSRLGLRPAGFIVSVPTVGGHRREHIRVLAPEGTELSAAGLVTAPQSERSPGAVLAGASDFYSRLTPERGVVYINGYNRSDEGVDLSFTMWPQSQGFLRPALFTTLASALLLGAGAVGQFVDEFLSSKLEGNLDAAIALLLVVPSLYSIYLSRGGEHALRSLLLRRLRYVVFGAAVAHGLAVTTLLAMSVLPTTVLGYTWAGGAAYCCVIFGYFSVYGYRKRKSMSPVLSQMNRTSGPKAIVYV